uniref:Reverse transcriptase/retrotransposon-derived protein RNase H-like domain-containing protein n=1 Tax=Tanacetum cinerariifolium TaxID=118510 RepID=A0A6L2K3L2_TANCI|nr:hypothetical protein [Tanacetum cinerariifolium]
MTGGLLKGTSGDNIEAMPTEQIEGHLSALRSLLKEHNRRGNVSPIRLRFDDAKDQLRVQTVVTGIVGDADLKKPFKEVVKTPLTRRIIEFAGPEFKMPKNIKLYDETTDPEDHLSRFSSTTNLGEWPMPVWCSMFQQTLDGSMRGWFKNLPNGSIDGWAELRLHFTNRFSTRRACFKDASFITGVPEVMKISSFMDAHKCPELAKRFSDKVPKTLDEMMTRLDDFVRSEDAFASTEFPKGETSEVSRKLMGPTSRKEDWFNKGGQRVRGNTKGRDVWKDKIINMIRSWPDDKKRKGSHGRILGPKSVRRPGGLAGGNVRTLLQKLESRDEVAVEKHTDRSIRFHWGSGEALGQDRVGVSSTIHSMIKFPTPRGIATLVTRTVIIAECQRLEKKKMIERGAGQKTLQEKEGLERVDLTVQTLVNPSYPDQLVTIGGILSEECKSQLEMLLKKSMNVFAWELTDMTGVPRRIIEHSLNVNPSIEPVAQKRRVLDSDRTQVVIKEVEESVNAGIIRPLRYPTWIANSILMAQDDEEKTAFYPDRGTYCYTKMPFGLKNARATYQEACVDDMVIKSNDEKMLIADFTETFDNLRRINMKLNPKKCSFGVEEGKFLGYMVTSEGIWANTKKTKAIADMKSPQTLKEMQSLSGKLAVLKRFLSRFAKKSLSFFETLKDITKENKDEYYWTESTKKAFQEMKQCIVRLPLLTTPVKEEMMYVYLAVETEAVSAVLLTERKRKQCLIHYVSRTLNEAERNYAPMEKLALSLLHMSQRLRRYFEAHPIKNISYEPRNAIKGQVLANFLSEAPVGTHLEESFRLPANVPNQYDVEKWTIFTDSASNNKGFGVGLVLISPSGMAFTYALQLKFTSTNNEVEYEALLPGLRMDKMMKV